MKITVEFKNKPELTIEDVDSYQVFADDGIIVRTETGRILFTADGGDWESLYFRDSE